MTKHLVKILVFGSLALLLNSSASVRASDMNERIQAAIQILDDKQQSPEPIPVHLLNNAKGIAIFKLTKAGLGIGGQGGEGILIAHFGGNSWTAPSAFNLGGASIGAQIGFTETRYIILLNTDEAVDRFITSGKYDWNATATGTAGTDSETERASTTDIKSWEIIVYKDSGGVYGGATLGGTSIERQDEVNQKAYGPNVLISEIIEGKVPPPPAAVRLFLLVNGNA